MQISRWNTSPRYERDGIVSYLLVSGATTGSIHLTTTLVEVQPGGLQRVHSHENEQCYFVLEGEGLITVGDETDRIRPGDCVFIPSGTPHGLVNDSNGVLAYFSAAAPSFGDGILKDWLPLGSAERGPTEDDSQEG